MNIAASVVVNPATNYPFNEECMLRLENEVKEGKFKSVRRMLKSCALADVDHGFLSQKPDLAVRLLAIMSKGVQSRNQQEKGISQELAQRVMAEFRKAKVFSSPQLVEDIELALDTHVVRFNRDILFFSSNQFRTLFSFSKSLIEVSSLALNLQQLNLNPKSPTSSLELMKHYLYFEELAELTTKELLSLYCVACRFDVERLMSECEKQIFASKSVEANFETLRAIAEKLPKEKRTVFLFRLAEKILQEKNCSIMHSVAPSGVVLELTEWKRRLQTDTLSQFLNSYTFGYRVDLKRDSEFICQFADYADKAPLASVETIHVKGGEVSFMMLKRIFEAFTGLKRISLELCSKETLSKFFDHWSKHPQKYQHLSRLSLDLPAGVHLVNFTPFNALDQLQYLDVGGEGTLCFSLPLYPTHEETRRMFDWEKKFPNITLDYDRRSMKIKAMEHYH